MLLCLNLIKFLKIEIGISQELFELAHWNFAWLIPTILAINMRTVGVLVDFLTKSEQQTYQTASNI